MGAKGNGMTEKTGLSGGMLGAVAGGVAVVVAVLGWQLWPRPTQSPPPAPAAPLAPAPLAATPTPPAPPAPAGPAPAVPAPVASQPAPPRFDTFRLGDDGTAIVAGIGAGGTAVDILVDGAVVAQAAIDRAGRFAAIFALPPAPQPRNLTLRMKLADGNYLDSAESVVIAPVLPPVATAEPAPPPAMAEVASAGTAPAEAPPTQTIAQAPMPVAPAAPAAPVAEASAAPQAPTAPQPVIAAQPAVAQAPEAVPVPPTVATAPAPQTPAAAEPAPLAAAPTPQPEPAAMPAQPSNLLVSDQGVRVLRPASDAPLAIDAISYSAEGAVRVSGKGGAGAFIRVYLNNAPQIDTLADDTGAWHGTLPPVTPGLYTLRADQIDAAGKVAARSETPFLREAPEALAAAGALAAGSGDTQVVTVQPGYTLWGIARQRYGRGIEYVKVFEANRGQIRNPDLIYPGQVFSLPQPE